MIRSPDTDPTLVVSALSVHYGSRPAISDISLDVASGEIVGLLGPNGSGKSTLLKVIAGMLPASHGEVRYRGAPLRDPHPEITYVPQRAGADWTFPISVLEAVMLGDASATPRWRPFTGHAQSRAKEVLARVGIDDLANVQIGALSGGQQQRVFLARAMLACGRVLLLDEPFTGVDVPTQDLFGSIFADLRAHGTAIVYATHDLAHAARTADRLVLINRTVVASGTPDAVMTEGALRTTFGGQVVILDGSGHAGAREPVQ